MKTGTLALLLWPLSGLGVTAGAHRYWTHRSYKATSVLEILGVKKLGEMETFIYPPENQHET